MNRTVTFALASLIAVSPAAGLAHAQDVVPATPDLMETGAIGAEGFQVVYLSALEGDESQRGTYSMLESRLNDPAALQQAQSELQAEPGLADALLSKNVQLQNVVHIQTAGDGSKIVYVR